MMALGRLFCFSRSFGSACFRQQYSHQTPLSSVFLARCLATNPTNKDLPKFKKARGPYIQFVQEKRLEIINSNPGIRMTEISKIVGRMWKSLSEEEKKVYHEKFEKEKDELKKEQDTILNSLTPEQKQQIQDEKQERKKKRKYKKIMDLRKVHSRPRPVGTNPFFLYIKSLDRGEATMKMYIQGASDFWKKMPEEDKKPFVDEARTNSRKYREELAEWEGRMLVEGHEDLISKTKLRFLKKTKRTAVRKPAVKRMKPPAGKTSHSTDESLEHEEPTHTRTIGTQTPEDEKTPPGTATTTDEKK